MATFLDRPKILQAIVDVIAKAKKEVIMIVPYIKLSELIFQSLKQAESKGIHLILVYRENKMIEAERIKLLQFQNVSLLSHPNVHSKCYLNEKDMIICSMNLYEYSENNNREMGVLLSQYGSFGHSAFTDAFKEVRSIMNSAELDRKAPILGEKPFKVQLFQNTFDILNDGRKLINEIFENKIFDLIQDEKNPDSFSLICKSYLDDVDVHLMHEVNLDKEENEMLYTKRLTVQLNYSPNVCSDIIKLAEKWKLKLEKEGYDLYPNDYKKEIGVYRNNKANPNWDDWSFEKQVKYMKSGLDKLMPLIKEQRLRVK